MNTFGAVKYTIKVGKVRPNSGICKGDFLVRDGEYLVSVRNSRWADNCHIGSLFYALWNSTLTDAMVAAAKLDGRLQMLVEYLSELEGDSTETLQPEDTEVRFLSYSGENTSNVPTQG